MSISKYNAECYPDPTAHDALEIIEQEHRALRAFRPIVYICSPYAGDIEANVAAARRYSRFAVDEGYIPIAPHLLFPQFLNDSDPNERELGLFFGNALMSKCAEVWVFGSRILQVEAGTTGYKGGDTGHGGRTYFRIKDEGCTDMEVHVMRDRFGDTEGFEVILGGDCELETMIRALKFITKVLEEESEEVYD